MFSLSNKCSTLASLFALATLPGDRSEYRSTPDHEDFKNASGYIKRVIDGEVCHAVDWNGTPGIDTIFREHGHRSHRIWRDYREWSQAQTGSDLTLAGNKACELLLKHFGPYHKETSDALEARRAVERERDQLEHRLEKEYPAAVRAAARDFFAPMMTLSVKPPPFPTLLIVDDSTPREGRSLGGLPDFGDPWLPEGNAISAEAVLRAYLRTEAKLNDSVSVEHFAREVFEKTKSFESDIQILEVKETLMRLPPIPGEGSPADMDRLQYGALICRHRAVVVSVLLSDAGYDIELVQGVVERGIHQGLHLFVFAPGKGILEPSADGPDFWREPVSVTEREGKLAITVKNGVVYKFDHRTPMTAPLK